MLRAALRPVLGVLEEVASNPLPFLVLCVQGHVPLLDLHFHRRERQLILNQ